jgi:O-antigen/teichoic acid export membrane protein
MGIIKRQSIYSTVISYFGVVIGFLSSAVFMPILFSPSQVGLVKLIVAITGIFSSVFSLGVAQMLFRYYPKYRSNPSKINHLFFYSLRLTTLGVLIALPFYLLANSSLLNIDDSTEGLNKSMFFVMAVFMAICARLFYNAIFGFIRMTGEIVIDAYVQNIFLKGGMLLLIGLYYFQIITFSNYIYLLLILYLLFPLILLFYLKVKKELPKYVKGIKFEKGERKELRRLSVYGTLSTLGGSIYLYLDTLMVNEFLGESEVGVYGTMFLFGIIINIPARGVKSVAQSVISNSLTSNDISNVKNVYQKSSSSLLVVGGFLFIGVWVNLYSVYGYLPQDYHNSEFVVLFIALAQLIDMMFGVNSEIINASNMYRYNTYFIFISIIIAVATNLLLIPEFGVNGAAFATLLAFLSVNLIRMITVYRLFKIHPFTFKTILSLVIIAAVTLIIEMIPNVENYVFNLIIKGSLVVIIYLPIVYVLKLSEDINEVFDKYLNKILKR